MTLSLTGIALAAVLILAAVAAAAWVADAFGYRRGHRDGADAMGDEWATAAIAGPDFIEVTWPQAKRQERRPS